MDASVSCAAALWWLARAICWNGTSLMRRLRSDRSARRELPTCCDASPPRSSFARRAGQRTRSRYPTLSTAARRLRGPRRLQECRRSWMPWMDPTSPARAWPCHRGVGAGARVHRARTRPVVHADSGRRRGRDRAALPLAPRRRDPKRGAGARVRTQSRRRGMAVPAGCAWAAGSSPRGAHRLPATHPGGRGAARRRKVGGNTPAHAGWATFQPRTAQCSAAFWPSARRGEATSSACSCVGARDAAAHLGTPARA